MGATRAAHAGAAAGEAREGATQTAQETARSRAGRLVGGLAGRLGGRESRDQSSPAENPDAHERSVVQEHPQVEKAGDAYRLVWGGTHIDEPRVEGVGVRVGDWLAVVRGHRDCAVVGYRVGSDGSLTGTWATNNAVSVWTGTERAVRR